ncbi:MAG: acyl-ACP--UDP-N-acetylglucosamine O-acyltransferase [Candidatus Omnitrophota bacterium]
MNIHSTAIVHPKAKIGKNVSIGPYSILSADVTIGENTRIGNFCILEGHTTIGRDCQIFTGAVIGSIPQDKKYKTHEKAFLEIGDGNIFREYVTVNPGTGEGGKTIIGCNNLFMAYAHVAHDCIIANGCVLANNGTAAGHVILEDKAIVGGLTGVHQFVRLGYLSITGGCSKVVQDIPPFSKCDGHPAKVYGLNLVGLKRAKIPIESIHLLKKSFKILFYSGLTKAHAIEKIEKEITLNKEVKHLIEFVKASKRGLSGSTIS